MIFEIILFCFSSKEYTEDITGSESSVFSTSFKVVALNDVTWLIVGSCGFSSLIGFAISSCRKIISFSTDKPMCAKTVASTFDVSIFYNDILINYKYLDVGCISKSLTVSFAFLLSRTEMYNNLVG